MTARQIFDNPVLRPGVAGDLQGLPNGQGSTAFSSRSPSFPIQVEAVKIFSQSRAPQRLLRILLDQLALVFFALFPTGKKCEDPAHPGVGTGCRVELMDAVSLAGVSLVAQHGVRLLLLVAESQEWCFLVCSSGLPSYPVAWSSRWCRLCLAAGQLWRLLEEFPVLRCRLVALFALGNLDFAFTLVSFSPSVFGCCLWSTSYSGRVRCLVPQWIFCLREALDEFHIFSTCLELRPKTFSPFLQNGGEVGSALGSELSAGFTSWTPWLMACPWCASQCWRRSSRRPRWRCGGFSTHFASFFALLRLSRS